MSLIHISWCAKQYTYFQHITKSRILCIFNGSIQLMNFITQAPSVADIRSKIRVEIFLPLVNKHLWNKQRSWDATCHKGCLKPRACTPLWDNEGLKIRTNGRERSGGGRQSRNPRESECWALANNADGPTADCSVLPVTTNYPQKVMAA